MQAMAECSGPPQSTRKDVLGTFYPSPEPVDSSTPSSAPLSRRTLLRHSSFVRAVCVNAPVRICAGGDQRWSSLPRQLTTIDPAIVFEAHARIFYNIKFAHGLGRRIGWLAYLTTGKRGLGFSWERSFCSLAAACSCTSSRRPPELA